MILNSLLHVVFIITGFLVVGLVLLRRGEGGGLGGALGGGMGDNVFGARTARVLDKMIGWVAAVFLGSAVLMYTDLGGRESGLRLIDEAPRFAEQKGEDKRNFRSEPDGESFDDEDLMLILLGAYDPDTRRGDRLTVHFFRDANGNGRLDRLDESLAEIEVKQRPDGSREERVTHRLQPAAGEHRFFAYAQDGLGGRSQEFSLIHRVKKRER
jgi:protein translocase SecG subunit